MIKHTEKRAEICPVCEGQGKIKRKDEKKERVCHGCDGRGWVVIEQNLPFFYIDFQTSADKNWNY